MTRQYLIYKTVLKLGQKEKMSLLKGSLNTFIKKELDSNSINYPKDFDPEKIMEKEIYKLLKLKGGDADDALSHTTMFLFKPEALPAKEHGKYLGHKDVIQTFLKKENPPSFIAYFRSALYYAILDWKERNKPLEDTLKDPSDNTEDSGIFDDLIFKEYQTGIIKFLQSRNQKLPLKIFIMAQKGIPKKDIATKLGIPSSQIKSSFQLLKSYISEFAVKNSTLWNTLLKDYEGINYQKMINSILSSNVPQNNWEPKTKFISQSVLLIKTLEDLIKGDEDKIKTEKDDKMKNLYQTRMQKHKDKLKNLTSVKKSHNTLSFNRQLVIHKTALKLIKIS
jgi:hypothetical protein